MNTRWNVSRFCSWLLMAILMWFAGNTNPVRAAAAPLTDADVVSFGHQLETHVAQKDLMFYANAFDFDGMMEKVVPVASRQASDADFLDEFERTQRYGLEVQTKNFKSLKFLRVTQMEGGRGVLMRMITTNGMVNYQNLALKRDATGRIRIEDAYIFLSGETFSDTIRREAIANLQEKDKSVLDHLFGDTSDMVKYSPQWEKMSLLIQNGQYQEGLDIYAQLPEKLQQEKFLLVQRLRAAQIINNADYLAALRLWRKCYPDDPSIDIISIDYYTLTKDYDQAIACIDRLDKVLGGDPYLDFERAALYSVKNDTANAEKYARQACEREPDLLTAGFYAIRLMEARQDYAACVDMLTQMNARGGFPKTALDRGLRSSSIHNGLLQSEPYKNWYYAVEVPALTPGTVSPKSTN